MARDWGDADSAFRIAQEMEQDEPELAELWWELFEERVNEDKHTPRDTR